MGKPQPQKFNLTKDDDELTKQMEEFVNLYKAKKFKMDEFLQNLLFNLNYIQYKYATTIIFI